MNLHHFGRVLYKTVGKLADMHQTILVDANIDKGTEGSNIGNNAGQFHAGLEIVHLRHAFLEGEHFELLARIPARFGQLRHNVVQRGHPDGVGDVGLQLNFLTQVTVAHQIGDRAVQIPGHGVHKTVAFRMHRAGVERLFAVAQTQETGCLLEGLGTETRHLF